jgi:hypothetical protein
VENSQWSAKGRPFRLAPAVDPIQRIKRKEPDGDPRDSISTGWPHTVLSAIENFTASLRAGAGPSAIGTAIIIAVKTCSARNIADTQQAEKCRNAERFRAAQ